jgi:hypothetical protein
VFVSGEKKVMKTALLRTLASSCETNEKKIINNEANYESMQITIKATSRNLLNKNFIQYV